MSTINASSIQPGYEPIAGYRLEEQIGSGGFGEVWRAEAPGGLHKAIKFVHGALNERQATRELRSLERIKGVHHPFLLTLERFEIVEGRLIIVTELADGSLEDIFRRHRDRGSCGIPRPALLAYLHDAADALDYLYDRYQLQHLDVKPGNLLMVGGHVKVGDFGLLKDLRDVDCSVVGGLTPIYAPPEVFDGRPSPTSDQYSLAVMYQELLTGTRPFTGRTIAQLATQHVHSAPNLEPLPASDRPVIARSLEKNPSRRYGGCLELVEALRGAGDRSTQARSRGGEAITIGNDDTFELDGDTRTSTFLHSEGGAVEDLPRMQTGQAAAATSTTSHALLVAVGGMGADCLLRLRERITAHSSASTLDLHSVVIDTATESIDATRLDDSAGPLRPSTPIWIPLRTPSQYRDSGTKHLASISRRWVYNVPRSGRTEGLRPLGRLALVDHGPEVLRKLSEAVRQFAAAVGDATPRIYLVGSLGGGTASGTAWDLMHLLRHLLDEHGLPQATVTPLLAAPPLDTSLREPLATADCHAALSEMHHFLLPGNSYPGDAGIGWPSVPAARSPLHDAYVVAARDSTGQSPTPLDMLTDYIWADATIAGPLLQAARDASGPPEEHDDANPETAGRGSVFEPVVRSLGIISLQSAEQIQRPRLARMMATRMLHLWLGRPVEGRELAAHLHEKLAQSCGLDVASLIRHEWTPLPAEPQPRIAAIADGLRQFDSRQPITPEDIEAWIASIVPHQPPRASVRLSSAERIAELLQNLRQELSLRLKDRHIDLTTAMLSVTRIIESIRSAAETYAISYQRHQAESERFADALRAGVDLHDPAELIGSEAEPGPAVRFAEARLLAIIESRLASLLGELAEQLSALVESLTDQAAHLAAAIQLLGEPRGAEANLQTGAWSLLPATIRGRGDRILAAAHHAVAAAFLATPVLEDERKFDGETIAAATSSAARKILDMALDMPLGAETSPERTRSERTRSESSADDGRAAPEGERSKTADPLAQAVRSIRPQLLGCGGQQRLLLLVGSEAERISLQSQIADAHGGTLSVAVVPGISPLLVHEAQRIPLSRVLSRLATTLGGDQQISARLQTRSDIRWNSRDED